MKAAIVPSVDSNWEVKEIAMPEAGEKQVLIKIRASGESSFAEGKFIAAPRMIEI
jgi:NADPH:quinone reductase-like Zn-dependent oxidoreductase